jgi:hypothetical protein
VLDGTGKAATGVAVRAFALDASPVAALAGGARLISP